MAKQDQRITAVKDELDRAHSDYQQAKTVFLDAQVRYESAREKFSGLLRLAAEMLPQGALSSWQSQHPEVEFMGVTIGDAIVKVLDAQAFNAGWNFVIQKIAKSYQPHMSKDDLVNALFKGGYEFKSATPLREVNAALIKLEGAVEENGRYRAADSNETFEWIKKYEADEAGRQASQPDPEPEHIPDVDAEPKDVPF